jgi:hypothetical protein
VAGADVAQRKCIFIAVVPPTPIAHAGSYSDVNLNPISPLIRHPSTALLAVAFLLVDLLCTMRAELVGHRVSRR